MNREIPGQLVSCFLYIASHDGCHKQAMEEALNLTTASASRNTDWLATGRWVKGELVEINETLEIAASNGAPKENLIQLEKDMARRKAHLDQQFAETEKLQAEKERNRKPMSEAELLKRRKALEEFIQQRDKALADDHSAY